MRLLVGSSLSPSLERLPSANVTASRPQSTAATCGAARPRNCRLRCRFLANRLELTRGDSARDDVCGSIAALCALVPPMFSGLWQKLQVLTPKMETIL